MLYTILTILACVVFALEPQELIPAVERVLNELHSYRKELLQKREEILRNPAGKEEVLKGIYEQLKKVEELERNLKDYLERLKNPPETDLTLKVEGSSIREVLREFLGESFNADAVGKKEGIVLSFEGKKGLAVVLMTHDRVPLWGVLFAYDTYILLDTEMCRYSQNAVSKGKCYEVISVRRATLKEVKENGVILIAETDSFSDGLFRIQIPVFVRKEGESIVLHSELGAFEFFYEPKVEFFSFGI